jgi:excinuclease ABC subunit C
MGSCSAPCEGGISRQEYAERVKEAVLFIEGKKDSLLRRLAGKMRELSAMRKFEEAAAVRDQVDALSMSVNERAGSASAALGLDELSKVLGLEHPPRRIEAFDISNIKGEGACGSMVSFRDGKPDKANYRMFRIRGVGGQDDYAMMREIVRRRYTRRIKEGTALPDLILIDGGRGHLSSAAAEAKALGLARIPMIGLAKVFEHIYTLDKDLPISLPPSSRALQLVQRVRDESHRFAIRYHHILRRKALVGEKKRGTL